MGAKVRFEPNQDIQNRLSSDGCSSLIRPFLFAVCDGGTTMNDKVLPPTRRFIACVIKRANTVAV